MAEATELPQLLSEIFHTLTNFEIDLEELISENYDVLFEDNRLMLVYRQTPGQGVSDVYALNEKVNCSFSN